MVWLARTWSEKNPVHRRFAFDGSNKNGLLQFSLKTLRKTRQVSRRSPSFFFSDLYSKGTFRADSHCADPPFFFLLPSLSTLISRILGVRRGSMQTGTGDRRQLAFGQGAGYKCTILFIRFACGPIQQTPLFVWEKKNSSNILAPVYQQHVARQKTGPEYSVYV